MTDVIYLKSVGATPDARMQALDDTVYQLAVTHMISGLRTANRLRSEKGQPPLTSTEILSLLGIKHHEQIALQALMEIVNHAELNPYPLTRHVRDAVAQAQLALGIRG